MAAAGWLIFLLPFPVQDGTRRPAPQALPSSGVQLLAGASALTSVGESISTASSQVAELVCIWLLGQPIDFPSQDRVGGFGNSIPGIQGRATIIIIITVLDRSDLRHPDCLQPHSVPPLPGRQREGWPHHSSHVIG